MNTMTKETLAQGLEDLICEASRGLRAARDRNPMVHNPKTIDIEFLFLIEANVGTSTTTTTEEIPETTSTESRTDPVTTETTTETRAAVTRTSTQEIGQQTRSEVYTPPATTTATLRSGSDEVEETSETTSEE